MFIHPQLDALRATIANNPVVQVVGLPGVGKSELVQEALEGAVSPISPTTKPSGDVVWFDVALVTPKILTALNKHVAGSEGRTIVVSSRIRLPLHDSVIFSVRPLALAATTELLAEELSRREIYIEQQLTLDTIALYLCGLPSAISASIPVIELFGVDHLLHQLESGGVLGLEDKTLRETAVGFWESLTKSEQVVLTKASHFNSFTITEFIDAQRFHPDPKSVRTLLETGLIERESGGEARFRTTQFANEMAQEFGDPLVSDPHAHSIWALQSNTPAELEKALARFEYPDVEVRKTAATAGALLIERGRRLPETALSELVQFVAEHSVPGENLLRLDAVNRAITSGDLDGAIRISSQRRETRLPSDVIAGLEIDGVIFKTQQNFAAAVRAYDEAIALGPSGGAARRIENNRITTLWESGERERAREEAARLAEDDPVSLSNLGVMYQNDSLYEQAYDILQRARALHIESGNKRYEAIVRFDLGTLCHERFQFQQSVAFLRSAKEQFDALGESRFSQLAMASLAAASIPIGDSIAFDFDEASDRFRSQNDVLFSEAIELYQRLAQSYSTLTEGEPLDQFSFDGYEKRPDEVQVQARILAAVSDATVIWVSKTRDRFRVVGEESTSLPSGSATQLIFYDLIERRLSDGSTATIMDIARAGWPDEIIREKAATNRAHVALTTLRKAGLKTLIVKTVSGYQFAPSVLVLVDRED